MVGSRGGGRGEMVSAFSMHPGSEGEAERGVGGEGEVGMRGL